MLKPEPVRLLDCLFTTEPMRAVFSSQRSLQAMLDFEAALARALVSSGIAPRKILPAIESSCDAAMFKVEELANAAALAGNVVIPLVKELTRLVAEADKEAAHFVHWGATSQDVMDTALILQVRDALSLLESGLIDLSVELRKMALEHKHTLLAGRTWLQHGSPVTLGFKAAVWLDAIERHRERLREMAQRALVLQFGGSVGTLATFEDRGLAVATALASEFQLVLPDIPWHTNRDRIVEVATTLGLLVGSLGKIARDIALLTQSEIGELSEPHAPGRGGSSAMPHKRNPVGSAVVLSAAVRVPALVATMLSAMVQEHERGLGSWQAEWQTLPEICMLTAGALAQLTRVIAGLEVHQETMVRNLETTRGLIFSEAVAVALAQHIGKMPAHEILEQASQKAMKENNHLRDVLMEDARVRAYFTAEDLDRLFDARNYISPAKKMVDRVLRKIGDQN